MRISDATGPGIAIQTRSGRLVIPRDYYLAGSKVRESHVIYTDNHEVWVAILARCPLCKLRR